MNPYIGNSPYTSSVADIGYPQVNYQSSPQDTSMQDTFHSQALQQMQQLGVPKMPQQGSTAEQLAMAKALRDFKNKDQLAPGWQNGQWQGQGFGYTQGTSLNTPSVASEYTAPANWMQSPYMTGEL